MHIVRKFESRSGSRSTSKIEKFFKKFVLVLARARLGAPPVEGAPWSTEEEITTRKTGPPVLMGCRSFLRSLHHRIRRKLVEDRHSHLFQL